MSRTKWVLAVLAMATIASLPSRAEWDIEIGTTGFWEMVHSVQPVCLSRAEVTRFTTGASGGG